MKISNYFKHQKIRNNYDYAGVEKEQSDKFDALSLNYLGSKEILAEVYSRKEELQVEMASCHHNLFAALSVRDFTDILEIGTHTGAGAALLSTLFPSANIDTIDLPDDHPVFEADYGRNSTSDRNLFLKKRNQLLSCYPNVHFRQTDSTSLTFMEDKKYDFIWVDGNHVNPYVTVDITNSLRLTRAGGVIACDDVRTTQSATLDTLNQFRDAGLVDYHLIHKRTSLPDDLNLVGKYIAVVLPKKVSQPLQDHPEYQT
jgi:predicted O-methyltransferase YrrM